MSNLTPSFFYQGKEFRTVTQNNEPWFVAKDACELLELEDVSKAVLRLSDSMKGTNSIPTLGGNQEMLVISEAGLYKLVFTSRKPEAEKFTDWVASEVIPSIRKHGMYAKDELLDNPDLMIEVITKLKDERQKRLAAETKIEQDKPKVLFADAVAVSNSTILIGELAKLIKQNGIDIGEKRLFEWLRNNGYLISRRGTDYNAPTQRAMELKLFKVKETVITHSDGHVTVSKTTKVTGNGSQYFINKFLKNKIA